MTFEIPLVPCDKVKVKDLPIGSDFIIPDKLEDGVYTVSNPGPLVLFLPATQSVVYEHGTSTLTTIWEETEVLPWDYVALPEFPFYSAP